MLLNQASLLTVATRASRFLRHESLHSRSLFSNSACDSRKIGAGSTRRMHRRSLSKICCISKEQHTELKTEKKRKVVEHVCLIKAKNDLSEEEEKDMLDFLYTSQYQMRGIVAVSLGRIGDWNEENYTHALFMRFHMKDDLVKFYDNPFYLKVLKEHVMPYCHGFTNVDFESEVEDDILPIFRKGEEFNYGEEFVLLISFSENALDQHIEYALASLQKLASAFPSLIVQSTQGSNVNTTSQQYTHAVVIRFRSLEAVELFVGSSEYKEVWRSKFEPFILKSLSVHFSVDPVGTDVM